MLDDVKMRVLDLLGADFPRYSDGERTELEAALRTDDPAKLEAIYARWAQAGPRGVLEPPPEPTCPAERYLLTQSLVAISRGRRL